MAKLKNHLKKLAPDMKIKIGTEKGSAWFYIGTAGDFERNIGIYNEKLDEMWTIRAKRAKQTLDSMIKNNLTLQSYVRDQLSEKNLDMEELENRLTLKSYEEYIDRVMKRILMLYKRKLRMEEIEKFHECLQMRDVLKNYLAKISSDDGYMSIVIDGLESGTFWSADEVKFLPAISFNIET